MRALIKGPPYGFYPDNSSELKDMLVSFEQKSRWENASELSSFPGSMVVPHAGLMYSGLTASYGYSRLRLFGRKVKRAVLFAPSHRYQFEGVALPVANGFQTPLGSLFLDEHVAKSLHDLPWVHSSDQIHLEEHSLQVQIPFLQHFLPGDITLIPFIISQPPTYSLAEKMMDELLEVLGDSAPLDTVFIASSDLYHGSHYTQCNHCDQNTIQGILNDSASAFFEKSVKGQYQACGSLPIACLKILNEKLGFERANLLHHTNSNDITGDIGGYVVGYSCIAFDKGEGK